MDNFVDILDDIVSTGGYFATEILIISDLLESWITELNLGDILLVTLKCQ